METCVFLLGIEATSKRLFDLQFVFYRAVKKHFIDDLKYREKKKTEKQIG